VRISSEIVYHCEADVFGSAEGSIGHRPLFARSGRLAGVASPGHVFKGIAQEPKRAPGLLLSRRYVTPRVDRRGYGWIGSSRRNP
jgi:hypothetical protein